MKPILLTLILAITSTAVHAQNYIWIDPASQKCITVSREEVTNTARMTEMFGGHPYLATTKTETGRDAFVIAANGRDGKRFNYLIVDGIDECRRMMPAVIRSYRRAQT